VTPQPRSRPRPGLGCGIFIFLFFNLFLEAGKPPLLILHEHIQKDFL
jgi:hypothetical protein